MHKSDYFNQHVHKSPPIPIFPSKTLFPFNPPPKIKSLVQRSPEYQLTNNLYNSIACTNSLSQQLEQNKLLRQEQAQIETKKDLEMEINRLQSLQMGIQA